MAVLVLPIKREFFEKIKSGEKTEEYREIKPYWTKRLEKKGIVKIKLRVGYPSVETPDNTITCEYRGHTLKTIDSKVYGGETKVYAIDVSKPIQ
jgi:hypothetical protein